MKILDKIKSFFKKEEKIIIEVDKPSVINLEIHGGGGSGGTGKVHEFGIDYKQLGEYMNEIRKCEDKING